MRHLQWDDVIPELPSRSSDALNAKSLRLQEHLRRWDACWWPIREEWIPHFSPGPRIANWATNMLAVLADSPSLARSQMHDAVAFAQEQGIPLDHHSDR